MPTNFTTNLPTTSPVSIPPPYTEGSEVSQAAEGIADAIKTIGEVRKQRVLGDIAGEAQNIVTQTSAYQQAKDAIVSKLGNNADAETFTKLSEELERLRKGEVQGILSPSAATMRLNSLAKTYINRYPRFATEIRQMLKLVSGDITPDSKSDDISDPILKARYKLAEEAEMLGMSTMELGAVKDVETRAKIAEARLNAAVAEGSSNTPQLMWDLIDSTSPYIFADLMSGMMSRIVNGTFNKETELASIRMSMANGLHTMEANLTRFELENNVKVDHTQFRARMEAGYAPLIALANEADSVEKQRRLAQAHHQILQAGDYKYMHDILGPYAAVVPPEKIYPTIMELAKMARQIKQGQLASFEKLAEFDPEAKMHLDMFKRGAMWGIIGNQIAAITNGDATTPTNPILDNTAAAIVANSAGDVALPKEERKKLLVSYINSRQPVDAIVVNPQLRRLLAEDTESQAAFDNQFKDVVRSEVHTLPLDVLKDVVFEHGTFFYAGDPQSKFTSPIAPTNPQTMRGRRAMQNPGEQLADRLNQYMEIMSGYKEPEQIQSEVIGLFEAELALRVEREMSGINGIIDRTSQQEGKEDDDTTTTEVDSKGNVRRFEYDREQDLIIDRKRGRIIPDTYEWTPEELEQFKNDMGVQLKDLERTGPPAEEE